MSLLCVAQRKRTKHAGKMGERYKTHVYCRACGTFWDRDPARKGKRQKCGCCGQICRERSTYAGYAVEKYAKIKAAKIKSEEHANIQKSIKSEVRNMVHNAFPEIIILDAEAAEVSLFDSKVVAKKTQFERLKQVIIDSLLLIQKIVFRRSRFHCNPQISKNGVYSYFPFVYEIDCML